jgi:formamidopyrimidine-DNA glycosylase
MPELPDIELYLEALDRRVTGTMLERIAVCNPFLLRTVDPPLDSMFGRRVVSLGRLGKRIVFELEDEYFLVLHLMIAGRLQWKECDAEVPARSGLALFEFDGGTLILTEAGKKRRASLHAVHGRAALKEHDQGGLEVFDSTLDEFSSRLVSRNHSVKRTLCDPTLFSGIGNAYSDEILHKARLSPFKRTQSLSDAEIERLFDATRETLSTWVERLKRQSGTRFPAKVTAFRTEMAVHGKYGQPCPSCGTRVQRIVYAANETNYCPGCQTEGKLLRDRALSRLLRDDWPVSVDDLDEQL